MEKKKKKKKYLPTGTLGWLMATLNNSFNSCSLAFSSSFFFCPHTQNKQTNKKHSATIYLSDISNIYSTISPPIMQETQNPFQQNIKNDSREGCVTLAAALEASGLGWTDCLRLWTYFWTFLLLFLFFRPKVLSSTCFCFLAKSAFGCCFGGIFNTHTHTDFLKVNEWPLSRMF